MSATNSTANYGLPIFVGSDVPSWLTDWNGAMGDIDTAIAAAKAVADSALLASGNNTSNITTIQGQITTLQTTVGTHTTQIGTISGNINTINSLIGNGTPTTTDQTIIGAINELHADQGDLANLTTTDKSSLVAAINEAAQGGGGGSESVRYYNGYIQYSTDGGVTWINLINVSTPQQLLPIMTSATSAFGTVSTEGSPTGAQPYMGIDGSTVSGDEGVKLPAQDDAVVFTFATPQYIQTIAALIATPTGLSSVAQVSLDYTEDGLTWQVAGTQGTAGVGGQFDQMSAPVNKTVVAIRIRHSDSAGTVCFKQLEAYN